MIGKMKMSMNFLKINTFIPTHCLHTSQSYTQLTCRKKLVRNFLLEILYHLNGNHFTKLYIGKPSVENKIAQFLPNH